MKLGLGLGLSASQKSDYSFTPIFGADYNVMAAGQSLQAFKFTKHSGAGRDAFIAEAETHFPGTIAFFNGATGGSALRSDTGDGNHWWNVDTDMAGPALNTFYSAIDSNLTSRSEVDSVLWSQGNDDYAFIPSDFSKAEYKATLLTVFTNMRTEIGTHLKIFISPIHRRTSGTNDAGWQAIREAQYELITETAWIYLGAEFYDLTLVDETHLTQASYEAHGEREARRIAAVEGHLSETGTLGPAMASASLDNDILDITITHDAGTDFTPTSGLENFTLLEDGTAMTGVTAAREDANTIRLTLPYAPNISQPFTLYNGYGLMLGLNNANVLKDNATPAMPIRTSSVTPALENPIATLSGIKSYWEAGQSQKSFSSGNNLSQINTIAGTVNYESKHTSAPVYNDTLFGGLGGLEVTALDTTLGSASNASAGDYHTIGMVVSLPGSANNSHMFNFADSSDLSDNDCRAYINAAKLYYARGQGGTLEQLTTDVNGADHIFVFRYTSRDNMDLFWNGTAVHTSIDPEFDYADKTRLLLMGRLVSSEARIGLAYGGFFHASRAMSDTEIADTINYWSNRYSINLS